MTSYPQVGGYGYGAGFGAGFGALPYPAIDVARVEELKGARVNQVVEQAEVAKAQIGNVQQHQLQLIEARSDQEIQAGTMQINARREQAKMQVAQGAQQQALALDQRQLQATAQIEQQALAARGQVGFGFSPMAFDAGRVEELKGAQVGQITERAQALRAQISQIQEQQCQMIDARADQEVQMLIGQVNARREQAKMQTSVGGQQQLFALEQRQAQQTTAIEHQAMTLAAQARQQEAARSTGSYVPPVGLF